MTPVGEYANEDEYELVPFEPCELKDVHIPTRSETDLYDENERLRAEVQRLRAAITQIANLVSHYASVHPQIAWKEMQEHITEVAAALKEARKEIK